MRLAQPFLCLTTLLFDFAIARADSSGLRLRQPLRITAPVVARSAADQKVLMSAIKLALDDRNTIADRTNALSRIRLEDFDAMAPVFMQLLARGQPEAVAAAALAALDAYPDRGAMDLILASWGNFPPALKSTAVKIAFNRRQRLPVLFEAIRLNKINAAEIEPRLRDRLLQHPDAEIARGARRVFEQSIDSKR